MQQTGHCQEMRLRIQEFNGIRGDNFRRRFNVPPVAPTILQNPNRMKMRWHKARGVSRLQKDDEERRFKVFGRRLDCQTIVTTS